MFQYAAGRVLSLRLSTPLFLDVSGFSGYGLHNGFELPRVFSCDPRLATPDEVRELIGWRASPLAQRMLGRSRLQALYGESLVVEPHLSYWPGIREVGDNTYLSGYWQSEKYFSDASEAIRSDFAFSPPFSEANAELASKSIRPSR